MERVSLQGGVMDGGIERNRKSSHSFRRTTTYSCFLVVVVYRFKRPEVSWV